ncbi:MAG: molecular chaperone DnaK, partial [Bacteroidetes bacterium]
EASTGLSKEEIEKMKREAEANAEADRQARERVEKLNAADSLIFQTEKQLKDYGDKIPADKRSAIDAALNDLKEAHKAEDLDKIDSATAVLNTAWQAASQELYQAAQEQQQAGGETSGEAGDGGSDNGSEDVTDVEFEEVKGK